MLPAGIFFSFMYFSPESPYWYLLHEKREEAEKVLGILRPNMTKSDLNDELNKMTDKLTSTGTGMGFREIWKPGTRLPILIGIFIHSAQQLCGANVLMYYTSKLYVQSKTNLDIKASTLYNGGVQIISTLVSIALIDKIGRKGLLSTSMFGIGVFKILLAVYFMLLEWEIYNWPAELPVIFILLAVFFYTFGGRTVTWLLTSEMFNTRVRASANSICQIYNRLLGILVLQVSHVFLQMCLVF